MEQFVFAMHQWAHQQLRAPVSPHARAQVRVILSVYGFVGFACISVYCICLFMAE